MTNPTTTPPSAERDGETADGSGRPEQRPGAAPKPGEGEAAPATGGDGAAGAGGPEGFGT